MTRRSCPPVSLAVIAEAAHGRLDGDPDVVVTGLTQDSREVAVGDLFCCVSGQRHDGHDHAADAVAAGARALLVERRLDLAVAQIVVDDVRQALGPVAARAFGDPSASLRIVGVTGTNGKTSTVAILASVLNAAGEKCATIGTLTGERTTPEAIDLQATLRAMVDDGATAVAMEVSSHALAMGRVEAVAFDIASLSVFGG